MAFSVVSLLDFIIVMDTSIHHLDLAFFECLENFFFVLKASVEVGSIFVAFAVQTAVISAIMTTAVFALAVIFVFFVVGVKKGVSAEDFQDRLVYITDALVVAVFVAIALTLVSAVALPPNHIHRRFSALFARLACVRRDFDEIIGGAVVVEAIADLAFLVSVRQLGSDTDKVIAFAFARTAELGARSLDFLGFKPLLMTLCPLDVAIEVALQNKKATTASRVAFRESLDVLGLVGNRHLSDTFVSKVNQFVGLPKYIFGKKFDNFFLEISFFSVAHFLKK